jgi:tetratricopeptide (TPR) repeat protein
MVLGPSRRQRGRHQDRTIHRKNAGSPTFRRPSPNADWVNRNKDYDPALKDFDRIIDTYPSASNESSPSSKRRRLSQQKDYKGMTETFGKLLGLSENPAAAQANLIGWAAFEDKDYNGAIQRLETASKLDPAQYGERAALRIILCYYYLQDRPALQRTIAENKGLNIPVEITRWLGRKSFEEGDFSAAEQYLLPVVKESKNFDPAVLIELAEAEIQLGKTREAAPIVAQYLEVAREPFSRARGLQAQAAVSLGQKDLTRQPSSATSLSCFSLKGGSTLKGVCYPARSLARGDYDGSGAHHDGRGPLR